MRRDIVILWGWIESKGCKRADSRMLLVLVPQSIEYPLSRAHLPFHEKQKIMRFKVNTLRHNNHSAADVLPSILILQSSVSVATPHNNTST